MLGTKVLSANALLYSLEVFAKALLVANTATIMFANGACATLLDRILTFYYYIWTLSVMFNVHLCCGSPCRGSLCSSLCQSSVSLVTMVVIYPPRPLLF
jgi:hypothetical protein